MMSYSLHPNAQADFDAKADKILAMVRQRVDDTEPSTGDFLNIAGISVPVAVMWQSLQDSNIRTGVAFPLLDRAIRIEGDDFLPIVRLAEKIQQRRELSEAVGVQAILDVLILWCKQRIISETDTAFSRFLLDWLEEHATEHTIIFPIYQLWFAGVLRVCGVEIRTLEDAEVDHWYEMPSGASTRNRNATTGGGASGGGQRPLSPSPPSQVTHSSRPTRRSSACYLSCAASRLPC